ncbi:MAG: malonyl-ACP O-methyltransferase BioC [Dechloromonas sp.]|nr:malonyl-ACP O-methyltransferase BioC [Dechloromonas sp.]
MNKSQPPVGSRPPKTRIRQSFERAAPTYDSAAAIQRGICDLLLASLPAGPAPARLLDAGCGTGHALGLLTKRFPGAAALALDFSPAMLQRVAPPAGRLAGDLEHLPLADASVDLYWSSLAVQWCGLPKVLAEARRVLRPNGQLALASLGPDTFHELRHAFAGVDSYRHTLAFHTPGEIAAMARTAGFSAIAVHHETRTAHYADFRTLLKAVKAIGANQLGDGRRTGLMSRSTFAAAEAASETLRTPAGLPLTYDVVTLIARP